MRDYSKTAFAFLFLVLTVASACKNKSSHSSLVITETKADKGDTSNAITDVFGIPEPVVTPSPQQAQLLAISPTDEVLGYDVSPTAPVAATLVKNKAGNCSIQFWQIGQSGFSDSCVLPEHFSATEIKWHPQATALFIVGLVDKQYQILRVEKTKDGWNVKSIFSSALQLKSLIVGPRPFITSYSYTGKSPCFNYRIFFGEGYDNNAFRTVSVTENGGRLYQVVGPEKTFTHFENEDPAYPPSVMKADWALPVMFHPAGHELIWQNKSGSLFTASYNKAWDKYSSTNDRVDALGKIAFTPNGLGLIRWRNGKPGLGIYLPATGKEQIQLGDYNFVLAPCSVADGKGVVGLTKTNGQLSLSYLPIQVPLADVVNAWMFAENAEQCDHLQKDGGLFRPTKMDQLYKLYDTENYLCNGYDESTPTRPYLVTTDVFWELYGAAYEGLFVVKERYEAIPDFWKFADATNTYYKDNNQSKWAAVFATLQDIKNGNKQNAEVRNIEAAGGLSFSPVLKKDFDYSGLKVRGHYASSPDMQNYFRAFKYFTTAFSDNEDVMQELNTLPAATRKLAEQWIESYMGFIAPSRSKMVFAGVKNNLPAYNQFPGQGSAIFPLSWGFDNEILYTDVYHNNVPAEKQISGPGGMRILPTGFDLAAVLGGNSLAEQLLQSDYDKYPPLRKAIDRLKQNFKTNFDASKSDNLYDKWLNALATQWSDTLSAPNGKTNEGIWKAKRLQTGLASWATLRHATSLVNETGAAECGEGGFEEILLRAPRGYVEPDPKTFAAIADLLESSIKYVTQNTAQEKDIDDNTTQKSLYDGIVSRLKEAAKDARLFQSIAEREKSGGTITNDEYEKILYLGRVAEHDFLIFKSLSNKNYGLADPEPMAKIAEVFVGKGVSPYLMSAVGNTLEWDNVVPYFGRHEIVKGAVYSYYEFTSEGLLDDNEWREKLKSQPFQPWVDRFISKQELSSPATTLY